MRAHTSPGSGKRVFEPFNCRRVLSRKPENYSERFTQLQAEEPLFSLFCLSNESDGFFGRRHDIHTSQDELLPADEPRGGVCRIEQSRVDDGGGKQRRLLRGYVSRARTEIRARGGLRAVDTIAPFDDVEIQLENPRLLQLGLESPGDQQLPQLAQRILRRREVQVFPELLRDRAAAACQASARPVGRQRFLQLIDIQSFVLPEQIVFRDQHSARQVGRDVTVGDPPLRTAWLLPFGARLRRPQLDESRRRWIVRLQRPDIRKSEKGIGQQSKTERDDTENDV